MEQQNKSFRTLAVPGKLGKTTIHKVLNGQQLTISYPKAELIATGLGVTVEEAGFRPQWVEGEGE
jgi:hypothetical protein